MATTDDADVEIARRQRRAYVRRRRGVGEDACPAVDGPSRVHPAGGRRERADDRRDGAAEKRAQRIYGVTVLGGDSHVVAELRGHRRTLPLQAT